MGIVGSSGPIMSSSIHRRSLQDVEALGLFHHGRGPGRHLTRQSSDSDPRRRSTASLLPNASSVTHLAGRTLLSFIYNRFTFFHQITAFIKVCVAFVFGLQNFSLKDFSRIYCLKGLKPKNQRPLELL